MVSLKMARKKDLVFSKKLVDQDTLGTLKTTYDMTKGRNFIQMETTIKATFTKT